MFNLFHSFKLLPGVVSLISCVVFSGCYENAPESELMQSDGGLNVATRSISGSPLHYPISVFAFDQNGACKAQETIEQESEQVRMNLGKGSFRITALSGAEGFKIPSKIEQTAIVSTNDGNYSTKPMMMGHADVVLSGEANATIQMAIQVAEVEVILKGIPENVSSVSVSFASQYSKINLKGEFSTPLTSSIYCTKENGVWKSGHIYLLPGSGNTTVCTISLASETGVNTYGYTYLSPLAAGIPYVLNGNFTEGFSFEGTIVSSGWNKEVVLDFNFGPGVHETSTSDDNDGQNNNVSKTLPQPASLWNGYVVALVDKISEKEADLLLVSAIDREKISSAKSPTAPFEAVEIEKDYSERGLTDWHIPTKAEATSLKTNYAGDKITALNNLLVSAGYSPFVNVETSSDNARYLCEGAEYSFTLKAGTTTISEAGTSTKYHLRLVKKVHIVVE